MRFALQWICPYRAGEVLRYTVGGLALPKTGGDADVAESGASHLLDSGMYRVYALHIHHKSKIAAPCPVAAILLIV